METVIYYHPNNLGGALFAIGTSVPSGWYATIEDLYVAFPELKPQDPPPPTEEELYNAERAEIDRIYNGVPFGRVTIAKETLSNAILREKTENIDYLREQLELAIMEEAQAVAELENKYDIYE